MSNETNYQNEMTGNLQIGSVLEALCAEIEIAWKDEGDDGRVDELAAAHPDLSEELYEFLADLIEVELSDAGDDQGDDGFSTFVKNWLEGGGYKTAQSFARQEALKTTLSSPSTPDTPPSAPGQILPFVGLLRTKTGLATRDIAKRMGQDEVSVELLTLVSRFPQVVPAPVCKELVQRVVPLGVNEQEAYNSFVTPTSQIAALRDSEFPNEEMSFELLLERSNLRAKARRYWQKVAARGE